MLIMGKAMHVLGEGGTWGLPHLLPNCAMNLKLLQKVVFKKKKKKRLLQPSPQRSQ